MSTQNGVIETATGDLLRAGPGVDFVNDGSFNSDTEAQRTDVPVPGKVRGDVNFANHHRWNGSAWVEVVQPTAMPSRAGAMHQLRMSFNTVAKVDISTGECDDSTNAFPMASDATITVDMAASGANGLDTGSEAADTWYAVHLIADKFGTSPVAGLFSLSDTAPTLPTGYNIFRRLGWVRNNASSDFLKFFQHGAGRTRKVFYDEGRTNIRPLVDGTSQTFTDVDLSSFVPTTSEFVFLLVSFETGGSGLAGNNAELRVDGATSANPAFQIGIGVVSDKKADSQVSMPCSSAQKIEYAVTDSDNNKLTLIVPGYEDRL